MIPEFMQTNKQTYMKYAPKFQEVFGRRLWDFWDMVTGFDVVKFDKELIKPLEGESTHDAILNRFGVDVLAMVKELL